MVEASESDPIESTVSFQCSQCDSSFKAEEDLNAHIGEVHSAPVLPTPEKERAPDQAPGELRMSQNRVQREEIKHSEEEGASPACKAPASRSTWNTSPLGAPPAPRLCGLTLWSRGPKCEKTFNLEHDWRCHAHEVHHLCMKVLKRDPAPCPYPGCYNSLQ